MGFFGRLFRRDPATDFERARSMAERGELVRALEIATDARRNLDDRDDAGLAQRLDDFLAETRRRLIASIRASADESAADDDYEDALAWLDAAQEHARHLSDGTLDRQLAEQRDELERQSHQASRRPPRSRPKPQGPDPEPEGDATQAEIEADLYTESLLGTLAERLVPLYEAQPDAFRVAWVALNMGRFDEALEGFDALVAASPDDPVLRLERGRGRLFTGEPEAAREDFDPAWKALGSEPVDAAGELTIPQLWVESSLMAQDSAAVVERLEGQEDAIPEDPQLAVLVGHALLALDRPDDARQLLAATYPLHPKRPDVSHLLAVSLDKTGERSQAIDLLERSVAPSCASGSCSKAPVHPDSFRTLATLHLQAAAEDDDAGRERRADRVRELVRHVAIAQNGLAEGDHVLLAQAFELDGDTDSAAHEMAEAERLRQIRLERGEDDLPETMAVPGPGGLGQGKAAL